MPDTKPEEKRFRLAIPFLIEEINGDERTPFFECNLVYHDLPYDGIVAVEAAMIELLERLNDFGIATAEEIGLGKKLEILNVGRKKGLGHRVTTATSSRSRD